MKLPFVIIRHSTLEWYQDMDYRFSCVLDNATGGRMSKTNYTKEDMYQEIHEAHCREREDAYQEGYNDAKEEFE